MHRVDGAAGRRGGDHREQCGRNDAKANFLALHVAASQTQRIQRICAVGFSPIGHEDTSNKQHTHRSKQHPTLPLIANHAAEYIGEGGANCENRDNLQEIRQCRRIFKWMRCIGIEEAATVGPEHFDGDLRGNRTDRDSLLHAFECCCIDIWTECLRHALPDQEQCKWHADRQQHVESAACHIDPEIAYCPCGRARKTAYQNHRKNDPRRGRQKILLRQCKHLHEIRHCRFATIVLPVGVGDEADSGVERQIGRHSRLPGGIERQDPLQAQQGIKNHETANVKQQHPDRIPKPTLFAFLFDSSSPIERQFNRPQDR